jgi:hypothetical protein
MFTIVASIVIASAIIEFAQNTARDKAIDRSFAAQDRSTVQWCVAEYAKPENIKYRDRLLFEIGRQANCSKRGAEFIVRMMTERGYRVDQAMKATRGHYPRLHRDTLWNSANG